MMELLQQRAEGRTSKHQFVRMLFQDSCQCVGGNENGRRSWGGVVRNVKVFASWRVLGDGAHSMVESQR